MSSYYVKADDYRDGTIAVYVQNLDPEDSTAGRDALTAGIEWHSEIDYNRALANDRHEAREYALRKAKRWAEKIQESLGYSCDYGCNW